MLKKTPSKWTDSEMTVDFSDAEPGDQFYKVGMLYGGENKPVSVYLYTVKKALKKDVVYVRSSSPETEYRLSKNDEQPFTYLERSDVQWAFDAIRLRNKQQKVLEYIRGHHSSLSEEVCDSMIAYMEKQTASESDVFFAGKEREEEKPTSPSESPFFPPRASS